VQLNQADIYFERCDFARDGGHHGHLSNSILTHLLLEKIQQTQNNAKNS
jgi:hypothetical protein